MGDNSDAGTPRSNALEIKPIASAARRSTTSKPAPADRTTVELVLGSGATIYLDSAGQARIRRPDDNPEEPPWLIESGRIRAWLAKVYYLKTESVLAPYAISRVVNLLKGLAESDERTDAELCQIVDTDPVLLTIIRMVNERRYLKETATQLHAKLDQIANTAPYLRKVPGWPNRPEAFGRCIRRLQPWLEKAGISVDLTEREKHNRWIILQVGSDSKPQPPSSQLSPINSNNSNTFELNDAGDGSKELSDEERFKRIMKEGS